MTAIAREGMHERLLHLLAASGQLEEWAQTLHRLGTEGRRLAVVHGPNRTPEAKQLARHFGARTAPLRTIDDLRPYLSTGDLLIALGAGDQTHPIQSVGAFGSLHGLLREGVVIWGVTGPPPDPLAPYCHDVLVVATRDPSLLLRGHRLVIRYLTRPAPADSTLAVVPTRERSS